MKMLRAATTPFMHTKSIWTHYGRVLTEALQSPDDPYAAAMGEAFLVNYVGGRV